MSDNGGRKLSAPEVWGQTLPPICRCCTVLVGTTNSKRHATIKSIDLEPQVSVSFIWQMSLRLCDRKLDTIEVLDC